MCTRTLLVGVFNLIFLLCATGQEARFVSTRGKDIVDPDGKPLLLRGVNLGNWLVPEGYMFKFDSATSPRLINNVITELVGPEEARAFWEDYRNNYITKEDIEFIRSLGLNSVRIPFNWRLFLSEDPPDVWINAGFEFLDRAIQWCRESGVWVVLDMHCAPGGQTGDNIDDSWGYPFLFDSPVEQERTIHLWRRIAERYRTSTTVIGYDLLNEPIPQLFDKERLNPLLEPLYRRMINGIREVDRNHIVFLGGAQWDTNFGVFGPPFDSKVVYTFHKYWCDTTQAMVEEYINFREKYNVPIWMGESGENENAWISSFRRLQERNGIGWCFWPYKKMDSPRCVVTFDRPAAWDVIRAYANGSRESYASIRASRPPAESARRILLQFVERSRFKNARPNREYIEALGCPLQK
jgi:aryl-phospho-beta-D-glucosidase BglC (GH1 family)